MRSCVALVHLIVANVFAREKGLPNALSVVEKCARHALEAARLYVCCLCCLCVSLYSRGCLIVLMFAAKGPRAPCPCFTWSGARFLGWVLFS